MLLKKWIKLLIIKEIKKSEEKILKGQEVREDEILYSIKEEIKNLLVLISLRISKIKSSILLSRKRLLGRLNRLEKLNHINDNKLISYNFNKNEMIRKSIISKLIINLLERIVNGISLKGKKMLIKNEIVISKPVIKENLSTVEIIFYYFIPNYKSSKWISRVEMYLNKLRSSNTLLKLNNDYKFSNYKKHELLLNTDIRNDILSIREKEISELGNVVKNNNVELMSLNELENLLFINKSKKLEEIKDISELNLIKNNRVTTQVRGLHNNIEKDLISEYLLKNKIMKNNINKVELNSTERSNIIGSMISSIDILLGNLNSKIIKGVKDNKLNMIISKYFGLKEVKIKGIHLKYEFNNTEILVKLIRKGISKKRRTVSRMFRFRLRNRIPLLYDKGILKNRINTSLISNLALRNNLLLVESNLDNKMLNNKEVSSDLYKDIKDYLNSGNKTNLNDKILYKNIVGWSLLLKGKVGGRKGKNRSTKIFLSNGSFSNSNLYINNLFDNSHMSAYSKDRLKLNYIKNSNFISYVDKSTNNGKLGISLKLNIL